MTIVIHDTTIVSGDDADTLHTNAAIAVDGAMIVDVGDSDALLGRHRGADTVDGRGRIVFPGFANIHTHFSLIAAKGIYEDLSPPNDPPFTSGLAPIPIPDLTTDEMRVMVRLAALESIRSGTTAVLEDGANIADYASEVADTGLRVLFCERAWDKAEGGIGDQGGFKVSETLARDGIERIKALHAAWHGARDGRITVGIAAWAPDMCSPELLKSLRALQDELGCISTIHLNQLWGEVAAVKDVRGRLPTEYLNDLGFLNDRVICAHCRCMGSVEETILGAARASVAFNAAIAARRGLSPRVADLADAGCLIGMGSDNMAEDMVEVMRTGLFMERVRRRDGRAPTPEEALAWATRNGYRAMGMTDGGTLTPGNKADLILVDFQRAHLVPHLRPVSTFVHQGQARDVEAVMVNGAWVMRDGIVQTIDEAATVTEAQAIAERAWGRLYKEKPDLAWPGGFAFGPAPSASPF